VRIKEFEHGLELAKPSPGYVRTPGLHASDLYGDFYKSLDPARYDKRNSEGVALPFDLAKLELGTTFEEVLEPALAQRLLGDRPGEFVTPHADGCTDLHEPVCACGAGIIYSPDYLFDIDEDGGLVLGEFKLTWYSMKDAPFGKKFAKYFTQIKLYCYWLGLTRARLYIFFVNGDYKPPSPVLRAWQMEFTRQELKDEYDIIARHARKKGLLK
jgi:hypothetical protein